MFVAGIANADWLYGYGYTENRENNEIRETTTEATMSDEPVGAAICRPPETEPPEPEPPVKTLVLLTVEGITELTTEPATEQVPEYISLGEFTLTAYCPCPLCCGIWSQSHPSRIGTDYIQKTASGTIPAAGRTVGADTVLLPFGTVVIIDGHEYVVEDTGSAANGKKLVDIFMNTHEETVAFGRRTAEVWVKK